MDIELELILRKHVCGRVDIGHDGGRRCDPSGNLSDRCDRSHSGNSRHGFITNAWLNRILRSKYESAVLNAVPAKQWGHVRRIDGDGQQSGTLIVAHLLGYARPSLEQKDAFALIESNGRRL